MNDIRKEGNFLYTQSSLSTFEACAYKFKLRYFEGLYWSESEDQRESFRRGNEFHLLAERYYMGLESTLKLDVEDELLNELEILKENHPLKEGWKYFPEFEIRQNEDGIKLLGRYDLIMVNPQNKIQIIDFKTNKKKLEENYLENTLQTKIYLFLLWENYNLILENARKIRVLEMNYYQIKYEKEQISIKYNKEKHELNKEFIKSKIKKIEEYDFENVEKQRVKHCNVCEFKKKCWK